MSRVDHLNAQILRCHRLAAAIFDDDAAEALRKLADRYAAEITEIEIGDVAKPHQV
ncbi:hypothetical protein FHS96_005777 [Sphingomonas zeicaulis]|uniref:hypothetical protein n=1 Tax=Sphingomonas zeicaulis TaxID=1632740 RepID=UPI003D25A275